MCPRLESSLWHRDKQNSSDLCSEINTHTHTLNHALRHVYVYAVLLLVNFFHFFNFSNFVRNLNTQTCFRRLISYSSIFLSFLLYLTVVLKVQGVN